MTAVLFVVGLALLVAGAEALVHGSAGLAARFGVPQLVIGLTVVAVGTSSPELAVSVTAAVEGQVDLALGNVLGSNIANILLVLGLAALVRPLSVAGPLVGRDVPAMIAVSCLLVAMAADGRVSRLEGVALVAAMVAYTTWLIRSRDGADADAAEPSRAVPIQVGAVVLGLALLVLGSRWMVAGAVSMAHALGIPELVIGLTIVAVGTSAPEIASSIVAGIRGHRDLAVGNVVGSNIVNILAVLGIAAAAAPDGVPVAAAAWRFDLPVALAAALVCLPISATGRVVSRREGALLLLCYGAYTGVVVLSAQHHAVARLPAAVAPALVVVAVAVLAVLAARAALSRRRA
jgi:cation:H+ antiporter